MELVIPMIDTLTAAEAVSMSAAAIPIYQGQDFYVPSFELKLEGRPVGPKRRARCHGGDLQGRHRED